MAAPSTRARATPGPRSHAARLASRDGYFAPESVIRRVGNSPLVPLLGGGAAVLEQVAHPLVAIGVTEHSDYGRDLWRRLRRTLTALYLIVYGTKSVAERAGQVVQAVHAHVHGRTSEPLGPFPAGTPYSASDPELMLWVHSTLVETSLALYRRFVRPLSADETEAYYREMALVAELFGTPRSVVPGTYAEFRAYLGERLASNEISVTRPAREVARVILRARSLPAPLRMLGPAHRLSTAALLPPRLRDEYGLGWSPARAVALRGSAGSLRLAAAPLFLLAARLSTPRAAFHP
jgi:uncharacterized protein (DUF2236 family)